MIAQLPQNLIHLERSQDVLDQHRGADRAVGQAEPLLGHNEDVVPQAGLQMALQLGQIEIGAGVAGQQVAGVVEEVEAEVEQRGRHRLAVDEQVLLIQVPAARAGQQHGRLLVQLVGLALRTGEGDGPGGRVAQVDLSLDGRRPGGGVGVFEVGHIDAGPGVEGVDDHLAVDRAGDLDPAVLQVIGDGRDRPLGGADFGGFGQKVGHLPGVDLLLPRRPAL